MAEELAQEAMIVVYRRWADIGNYDDPAGFARRVVANKSVSAFGRLSAEARAVARIRGHARASDEEVTMADDELWNSVRSLPARQRIAVTLRYVADLDTHGIAAVLECPDGTVRVLFHRAHLNLAALLRRDDWQESQ